jgi:hypothetical protein
MKVLIGLLLPMFILSGCYTQLANDDEYSGSDYYEYYDDSNENDQYTAENSEYEGYEDSSTYSENDDYYYDDDEYNDYGSTTYYPSEITYRRKYYGSYYPNYAILIGTYDPWYFDYNLWCYPAYAYYPVIYYPWWYRSHYYGYFDYYHYPYYSNNYYYNSPKYKYRTNYYSKLRNNDGGGRNAGRSGVRTRDNFGDVSASGTRSTTVTRSGLTTPGVRSKTGTREIEPAAKRNGKEVVRKGTVREITPAVISKSGTKIDDRTKTVKKGAINRDVETGSRTKKPKVVDYNKYRSKKSVSDYDRSKKSYNSGTKDDGKSQSNYRGKSATQNPEAKKVQPSKKYNTKTYRHKPKTDRSKSADPKVKQGNREKSTYSPPKRSSTPKADNSRPRSYSPPKASSRPRSYSPPKASSSPRSSSGSRPSTYSRPSSSGSSRSSGARSSSSSKSGTRSRR